MKTNEDEERCIKIKRLINKLKTEIYLLEEIEYKKYYKKLNKLEKEVNEIYWKL